MNVGFRISVSLLQGEKKIIEVEPTEKIKSLFGKVSILADLHDSEFELIFDGKSISKQ